VIDIWSHLSDNKEETLEKKKENLHICTKEELHAISSLAFRSYLKPYIAIDTWPRVSVSKEETHEKRRNNLSYLHQRRAPSYFSSSIPFLVFSRIYKSAHENQSN